MSKKLKKKITNHNKKKKKLNPIVLNTIRILIIIAFLGGNIYSNNNSFENTISLLAVSENSNGEIYTGSIINLNLKITPGSGETYVNLNSVEEIDTQISIINSKKIACDLFDLDCNSYDFYYKFDGTALILKGPSASAAIAVLTAKTIKNIKINNDTVITGSLNSGGIIGNVGGVDKKVEVAKSHGFKKVMIPIFDKYNITQNEIEVLKVMDIIEVYNEFGGDYFKLEIDNYETNNYEIMMKKLGTMMCERTLELKNQINNKTIKTNSSEAILFDQAEKSYKSSQIAFNNSNYYSTGSFCYNANLNYKYVIDIQENLTLKELDKKLNNLKSEINRKYVELNTDESISKIQTINDFYSFLIINDRINEAKEIIENANKLKFDLNHNINTNENNNSNQSNIINNSLKLKAENEIINQKRNALTYATERYYTVKLWKIFITGEGEKIKFDKSDIENACQSINREIQIKGQLLENYGLYYLKEDIQKQSQYSISLTNQYLCIYKGLELNGRINTLLNAIGIDDDNSEKYIKKINTFTNERLGLNSNGDFPLIPYIYSEYSEDLFNEGDFSSSMLYSNYALSYLDLNLYLEKETKKKTLFNIVINDLYDNYLFVGAILIMIGFLGY